MIYLIIDDDVIFAEAMARALQRKGFAAEVATDSTRALALIEKQVPNRVILDLKIGNESGLQLLPEIRLHSPQIEVLLLTGYSSISTAVDAIKLGAVQYLCKPVELEDILNAFDQQDQPEGSSSPLRSDPHSVDRLAWEHIQTVLTQKNGNISATARALGMHRRTLQRKLQKRPVTK